MVLYSQGYRPGNDFHLFYGFVILFTFSFAYIYRTQMEKRPALAWGLLLLFVMGLGLRAWANVCLIRPIPWPPGPEEEDPCCSKANGC